MLHRVFLLLLLAAVFLAGTGCASPTGTLRPRSSKTIVLDPEEKRRTAVSTVFAEELVIKLPPIGQPGYKWQVFWLDLRYLRQLAEIEADGGPDDPSTARFIALRLTNNRATIIRFLALREGAGKEDQPVAMLEVGVTVQDEGDTDALTATPPP